MNRESLSTKNMLSNIISMRSNSLELLKQEKPFSKLLKYVVFENDFYSEGKTIPPIKEIAKTLSLKYEVVRKQILAIYQELVLNDDLTTKLSFPKVSYSFVLMGSTKEKRLYVEVDHLPVLPRIGEGVNLPFFSAYMNAYHYYVDKVEHNFTDGEQEITFWLREGYYNSYWQYRKDKAWEENELGFRDFMNSDEFDLKRKLNVGRWKTYVINSSYLALLNLIYC